MKIRNFFITVFICSFFAGCGYITQGNEVESVNKSDKLTLIVYMAADNDLESYAIENLNEMENAKIKGINVITLVDRSEGYDETDGNWNDTRLYKISHDKSNKNELVSKRLNCSSLGLSSESETELDMGNYLNLKKLIEFVKADYPAENYCLIMWGHGTGWKFGSAGGRAFAIDDKTDTYMSVCDLGKALKNSGLSVVGFDTCFGCVFENLYEIKDCAEFTVASPGVTPSCGWDYKKLLERISESDCSSGAIAKIMSESSSVKSTVVRNSRLENLMACFEDFSCVLGEVIGVTKEKHVVLNSMLDSKSYSYTQYPCDMYLDILSLGRLFENDSDVVLSQSAGRLIDSVKSACGSESDEDSQIGIYLIQKLGSRTYGTSHPVEYVKNQNNVEQCAFIKNDLWWAPSVNSSNGSLLDKLFYE